MNVWGDTVLTKQETLLGRGAWVENRKVREPSRTALPMWFQVSVFMVKGFISGLSLGNQGPSWWHTYCSAKMDSSEEDSGRLVPFPNSSDWFWLVISMFLNRTSCHKITHASVYYGSWPGWVVSVSISLTEWHDIAMRGKKGSFPCPLQTCSLHLRVCRRSSSSPGKLVLKRWWKCESGALLCMGFSRQEYWCGLSFPSPGEDGEGSIQRRD